MRENERERERQSQRVRERQGERHSQRSRVDNCEEPKEREASRLATLDGGPRTTLRRTKTTTERTATQPLSSKLA